MGASSLDLRTRVLADWDAGMKAEEVAAKYRVSRAWVHRLVQRRRETGEIGPRQQTKFRARTLAEGTRRIACAPSSPRNRIGRSPNCATRCRARSVSRPSGAPSIAST